MISKVPFYFYYHVGLPGKDLLLSSPSLHRSDRTYALLLLLLLLFGIFKVSLQ